MTMGDNNLVDDAYGFKFSYSKAESITYGLSLKNILVVNGGYLDLSSATTCDKDKIFIGVSCNTNLSFVNLRKSVIKSDNSLIKYSTSNNVTLAGENIVSIYDAYKYIDFRADNILGIIDQNVDNHFYGDAVIVSLIGIASSITNIVCSTSTLTSGRECGTNFIAVSCLPIVTMLIAYYNDLKSEEKSKQAKERAKSISITKLDSTISIDSSSDLDIKSNDNIELSTSKSSIKIKQDLNNSEININSKKVEFCLDCGKDAINKTKIGLDNGVITLNTENACVQLVNEVISCKVDNHNLKLMKDELKMDEISVNKNNVVIHDFCINFKGEKTIVVDPKQ
jgi:hypothetical protein